MVFRYYAASLFWGIITPDRIGEAAKIIYLKKKGVSVGRGDLSVVLDRLLDLSLLLLLTFFGISIVFHRLEWFFIGLAIFYAGITFSISNAKQTKIPRCLASVTFLPSRKVPECCFSVWGSVQKRF